MTKLKCSNSNSNEISTLTHFFDSNPLTVSSEEGVCSVSYKLFLI